MRGRRRKAEGFMTAANIIDDLPDDTADMADAFVTLCIHAGIAAADVICCRDLGKHAQGESHDEAVGLLAQVRPDGSELAKALRVLLGMKTKAGYSSRPVNNDERKRAARQAERLLTAARERQRH